MTANTQPTAGLLVSVPVSSASGGGQQMVATTGGVGTGPGGGGGGQQTVVLTNAGGGQSLPFGKLKGEKGKFLKAESIHFVEYY